MSAFQDTREKTEQKVMVNLLTQIERNPSFTQRGLASELGIALGLMNQYLKRCVRKGWIRASQISPKRITYFLTPEGFHEKSQMVTDYLARSMTFFRSARTQCEEAVEKCIDNEWFHILLVGEGDLADIATLVVQGSKVAMTIAQSNTDLKDFDAVMVTDVLDPQGTFDRLSTNIDPDKIITLELLHISRVKPHLGKET